MAAGIKSGDTVYLPVARVGNDGQSDTAIRSYTVVATRARSLQVALSNGNPSDWIATSAAHKVAGVYVVCIGDMETEEALLDPLYRSVVEYCRLLLPYNSACGRKVRSWDELRTFWGKEGAAYSHVVLVAHGRPDAIRFGVEGWVTAAQLGDVFDAVGGSPRTFVSLCCETGRKRFASIFSRISSCAYFIAPYHAVHGAIASQVCQTFLAHHFLEGKTATVAYNRTGQQIPGGKIFRLWKKGSFRVARAAR